MRYDVSELMIPPKFAGLSGNVFVDLSNFVHAILSHGVVTLHFKRYCIFSGAFGSPWITLFRMLWLSSLLSVVVLDYRLCSLLVYTFGPGLMPVSLWFSATCVES